MYAFLLQSYTGTYRSSIEKTLNSLIPLANSTSVRRATKHISTELFWWSPIGNVRAAGVSCRMYLQDLCHLNLGILVRTSLF